MVDDKDFLFHGAEFRMKLQGDQCANEFFMNRTLESV